MEDKTDKKQAFIRLRAKGNSLDRIAKKLGVSKRTLISWSKEFEKEISTCTSLEMDALLNEHKMTRLGQMESLGIQLTKIHEELKRRDFSSVPTHKLIELELKILEFANKDEATKIVVKPDTEVRYVVFPKIEG